jgi:hypothetical protein
MSFITNISLTGRACRWPVGADPVGQQRDAALCAVQGVLVWRGCHKDWVEWPDPEYRTRENLGERLVHFVLKDKTVFFSQSFRARYLSTFLYGNGSHSNSVTVTPDRAIEAKETTQGGAGPRFFCACPGLVTRSGPCTSAGSVV